MLLGPSLHSRRVLMTPYTVSGRRPSRGGMGNGRRACSRRSGSRLVLRGNTPCTVRRRPPGARRRGIVPVLVPGTSPGMTLGVIGRAHLSRRNTLYPVKTIRETVPRQVPLGVIGRAHLSCWNTPYTVKTIRETIPRQVPLGVIGRAHLSRWNTPYTVKTIRETVPRQAPLGVIGGALLSHPPNTPYTVSQARSATAIRAATPMPGLGAGPKPALGASAKARR